MTSTYDAIVVGGGHNGLVAGAYLARSGARTLVLESRYKTGGAATTEAPWSDAPEFSVTRLSYVMSLLPPTIMRDLDLVRHGYKVSPMGPYYQAFPEGGSIKIFADDAKRNYDGDRQVVEEGRRGDAQVGRLDRRPGRRPRAAAAHRAAEDRIPQAGRPAGHPATGLASTGSRRADDRRRHPADDDEHRRPPRRLVRVVASEGSDRRQRGDRDLGRPGGGRDRLRHGPPLHR